MEEARDGDNAGDGGDAPAEVMEDPHPHQPRRQQAGCNCETGVETCPMDGNCLVTNVVYTATVETLDVLDEAVDEQSYTGLAEKWKARFYQHRSSFNLKM